MAVERKYERDIDVLLAEEFAVSAAFASWFLSQSKFSDKAGTVVDVFVSKADNLGESDLVVTYKLDDGNRVGLLIEDKIDAALQPQQAERYRLRAERETLAGTFSAYEVILCAPSSYPAPQGEASFDRAISYEQVSAAIEGADNSARGKYRAAFVATAAARRSSSWVRDQDDGTDRFWDGIYQLASREFPILERKAIHVTKNSPWINFRPRDMPTTPKLTYVAMKASAGMMDLTFGKANILPFHEQIRALLADGMTVHQTGASAAIRLGFPAFKVEDGLDAALLSARVALAAASRLVEFYRRNRRALDAAALAADNAGQ